MTQPTVLLMQVDLVYHNVLIKQNDIFCTSPLTQLMCTEHILPARHNTTLPVIAYSFCVIVLIVVKYFCILLLWKNTHFNPQLPTPPPRAPMAVFLNQEMSSSNILMVGEIWKLPKRESEKGVSHMEKAHLTHDYSVTFHRKIKSGR